MEFFIDTGNIEEIKTAQAWGILDGVTTNPTHVAKEGREHKSLIQEICALVPGPVSVETTVPDAEGMIREGETFATWGPNVVVKVPVTPEGIKAARALRGKGIAINVTLVFSLAQAIIAAKVGAAYVSPFVGRLDDNGADGMDLVHDICAAYAHYPSITTKVLAASLRHPVHVIRSALAGCHVATMPFKVMEQLFNHPMTDIGLEKFLADVRKLQTILDANRTRV